MTIFYVTTGAWGAGTGTPNTAAQVDGNFFDVDQRIVGLVADLAEGKMIDTVTYASNSFTLHFTDGTTEVIPLPIAMMTYRGVWINSLCMCAAICFPCLTSDFSRYCFDHTTPAPPAHLSERHRWQRQPALCDVYAAR